MTARTDIDSDRLIAALDARVDRREQRRAFFRDALGAMAVTGALGLASGASAQSTPTPTATPTPTYNDQDILNFALNLEYLEAQFYAYATTGAGISSSLLGGAGTAGSVNATGATAVPFADPIIARYAREIAADEVAHVTFQRNAIGGSTVVAQPALDLSVGANSAFSAAAVAAKIITAGQTFNPYANEDAFLLAAFIFEDVGVTAYKGAAPLLTKTYVEAAAGIMATEAYHAATIRGELYRKGLVSGSPLIAQVQGISDARDSLDGQNISMASKTSDSARSNWGNDTFVAPQFAGTRIGDMHFNNRTCKCSKRIVNAPRIVSEGSRIDDDCIVRCACGVNCIDEFRRTVALHAVDNKT